MDREPVRAGSTPGASWWCQCDCGTVRLVIVRSLINGVSKSCGCLKKELAAHASIGRTTTHGHSHSPTWNCWSAMVQRCTNPANGSYADYGGRGITVCDEWRRFDNFLADMGERPKGTSIDRIDNNAGYMPGNCRWATASQQARNRRSSLLVSMDGKTMCVADWCDALGIKASRIYMQVWQGKTANQAIEDACQRMHPDVGYVACRLNELERGQ